MLILVELSFYFPALWSARPLSFVDSGEFTLALRATPTKLVFALTGAFFDV